MIKGRQLDKIEGDEAAASSSMRKRTRTILFFSLFFAFVFLTPAVVLYSQGYRFDFEKRKITQTGAIFLKIEPKPAAIYINDKLVEKTDFFFGSALLENLLPGEYKIKIKKDGYYLWEKNLEVKEKQVTEAKSIILAPNKIDYTTSTKNIESFWPSPATSSDIISPDKKKSATFSDSEIWIFYLKDESEMPIKKAGDKLFLLRLSEKINDVFWLNNNYLLFNSGNNIKIAEIDDRDRVQTWEIGSFPAPKIFFNEADKKLYILSKKNLSVSEKLNY